MSIKEKESIKPQEVRLEILSEAHLKVLNNFCSYEPELVNYLVEDALKHQKNKVALTYLVFHRTTNELMAYITLTNDCVKLKKIKPELQDKLNLKGINYKSLPAIKIARLCVADDYLRKGLGTILIHFAIYTISEISKRTGCRFLVLDAKRNPHKSKDAIHFYLKKGFQILKERDRRETPLYLDTFPYLEEINKQSGP